MKKIFLCFVLMFLHFSFGQVQDSTSMKPVFMRNRLVTTKICQNLRSGIGVQKSFLSEIGYSRMKHIMSCTGFFSRTYYTSIEYVPKTPNYKNVFGIKIGLEYNLSIIAVGLETKYQTDFDKKDFVVTSKIGFGFSYVNLHYGYNISTNNNPFPTIGRHQFNLTVNLPLSSKEIIK
jgi:hypothetical protein